MLQQFTWQQFLIAALILTLIWYAAVLLIFYKKRLTDLALRKRRNQKPVVQSSYNPREQTDADSSDDIPDVMGKTSLPEGVEEAETGMFSFAEQRAGSTRDPDSDRDHRLGLIPDVVEELKTLFRILENEGATKDDFVSLFKLISSKYPQISGSAEQPYLDAYIRQNLPFEITQAELDKLWH